MIFHIHPDGDVYIRSSSDGAIYGAKKNDLELDANTVVPPLPHGMTAMTYDATTKIKVYYDAKQNAWPMEGRADDTDLNAIIIKTDAALAAKEARVAREFAAEVARRASAAAAADAEAIAAAEILIKSTKPK